MPLASPTLVARAVETEAEIVVYHQSMVATFSSGSQIDLRGAADRQRHDYEALPEFHPRQRRGVFRGDAYLGGCIVWERVMRVGPARLRTGCIGGVHTDQNHRNQGVASACMNDAIAFAKARACALLLLDGIPNFYHRFGYADVLDLTDQAIDRAAIPSNSGMASSTRNATIEDAPTLLALFERHFGGYIGSFERSLEQQEARLARGLDANNPPILAVDENGTILGYLQLRRRSRKERAIEVAGADIRLLPETPAGAPLATFTLDQIVQAVFGYRPVSYLATSPGASVPDALLPTLNVLFPTGQACIPGSDGF